MEKSSLGVDSRCLQKASLVSHGFTPIPVLDYRQGSLQNKNSMNSASFKISNSELLIMG